MHKALQYAATITAACLGIIVIYPSFITYLFFCFLIIIAIIGGVLTVFWIHIKLSPKHKPKLGAHSTFKKLENFRLRLLSEYETSKNKKSVHQRYPIILGRTVDSLLQQILDFVVRDYINYYLQDLTFETEALCDNIKEDLWGALQVLHDRLTRVDEVKLIACDITNKITNHFEKIREAKIVSQDTNHPPIFYLSSYVTSQEKELEFLRSLSEVMIMFLLPRSYSLSPTKYFVREVIACQVFLPMVDKITDPDFFNMNIIHYIEAQKMVTSVHLKAVECAANFDDFVKIINHTTDIETLKAIRYNIVTKLMQATTLQNLNRAKGVDPDSEKNTGVNKSELNAAKKLKKYINQLTFAKKECDKRLACLGWDQGYQYSEDKKVLPLSAIMDHVLGRKYFSQFLETLASQDLVKYWTAVEELRNSPRKSWHQIGTEIFYTFIRNRTSEIKVDKDTRKRMEAFLLGDKGPEVFYEIQRQVNHTLEDKYYQPFLISDYYKEMISAMEKEDITQMDGQGADEQSSVDSVSSLDNGLNVGDYSNYSRRKLDQLQEKLTNKMQALQALRSSLKPDSKVLNMLEKEVQWLQGEQRQLEAHLSRTEIWGENLGKWRAVVQSTEVIDEMPQFVLVVHMMENDTMEGEESISTGWVVCRSLAQFQELHRKLRPLCSELRSLELPSTTFKFLFGKTDKTSLEKAKQQIQKYLDFILTDERLNQSEAVYSFLSPSSDHLKHSTTSPKKSRFSLSTLFKSGSESSKDSMSILKESEEEDLAHFLDTPDISDSKSNGQLNKLSDDSRDAIAEPLFSLISEIFDMRGVFKYIRKSIIAFVQITYGRSINRQIRETISWWLSEQMLHYYATLFLKNFWPGGTLAKPAPVRTKEEKEESARIARAMFIENIPEIIVTLVGSTAARNGAMKIFDTFQQKNMNKQLFYELLELVVDAVFPEIR